MISVIVQRQPADTPGPDISDPLITSDAVARERGRNEIDTNCSSRKLLTGAGPAKQFLKRGAVVEVHRMHAPGCRGVVKGWSFSMERGEDSIELSQTLNIEVLA